MNNRIYSPFAILFLDPEKNIPLSFARVHRLAKFSENHGIDANRFTILAKGETDLRIPTPDNTPEPGNRRVEVVITQH